MKSCIPAPSLILCLKRSFQTYDMGNVFDLNFTGVTRTHPFSLHLSGHHLLLFTSSVQTYSNHHHRTTIFSRSCLNPCSLSSLVISSTILSSPSCPSIVAIQLKKTESTGKKTEDITSQLWSLLLSSSIHIQCWDICCKNTPAPPVPSSIYSADFAAFFGEKLVQIRWCFPFPAFKTYLLYLTVQRWCSSVPDILLPTTSSSITNASDHILRSSPSYHSHNKWDHWNRPYFSDLQVHWSHSSPKSLM